MNPNPLDGLPIQEPRPFSDFLARSRDDHDPPLDISSKFILAELIIDGVNMRLFIGVRLTIKVNVFPLGGTADQPIYKRQTKKPLISLLN